MFGQCNGPIWRRDDLSHCFQAEYLQTILPLVTCAISLLYIFESAIFRSFQQRAANNKSRATLVDVDSQEEQSDNDVDIVADLALQKTSSHATQPIIDTDKPVAEVWLVSTELLATLAQVAIGIASLRYQDASRHDRRFIAWASVIAVWAYISILVGLRLYTTSTRRKLPTRLWNHTAFLYGAQWLLQFMIFRSVVVFPHSAYARDLVIAQFALSTLLALIALLSRRGNRVVALEYEGDILPSREPLASIFSIISYSWVDSIIWQGYKKPLELSDVWNVVRKDKAENILARFRQVKKTHILAVRLLLFFKKQLLIQGLYCMTAGVFMFLPTLLLKLILEHLEDADRVPKNAAWLYAFFLFVSGLIQAIGDGQALWIGRKICIQIRALIVGEIYSKVLRRQAAATTAEDLGFSPESQQLSLWQKIKSWRKKQPASAAVSDESSRGPSHTQANNGTIINLMSVDSFKVAEICSYLHFLWASTPIQLVMAISLLYNVLGYSSFAGVALMVLVMPLNLYIAKSFQWAQKRIMTATDGRIHATNEVLQNIRIIKYFAWERRFADSVNEKRRAELSALWRKYILWSSAATIWSGVPIVITFASFFIFTVVEKRRLTPSIAFPALSMFSLLRVPLDQLADMLAHVQESKVSIDRVEQFLNEEETEKYTQVKWSKEASPYETRIALQNATLTWGIKDDQKSDDRATSFRLINIDVEFAIGKLNVIAGPTGSGKTSLLMAILGEMKLINGHVFIPGGYSRQDLQVDPETGLTNSVAYCAQQAWLVNATIKENIVFAAEYNENRYKAVITACALTRDLEILDAGDQTLVGEKGITLSGGQKQRISLARALYSSSRHLLLDDCLSAVDTHTAKHIFEQALTGTMMIHRTCILVSHNVMLTVPQARFVVVLDNGKVVAKGPPEEVIQTGHLGDELLKSRPTSKFASAAPSRTPSDLDEEYTDALGNKHTNGHAAGSTSKKSTDHKFVDTRIETKSTGSVKFSTIFGYLRSMGTWYYWVFAAFAFVAVQIGSLATNIWIRQWANAYEQHSERVFSPQLYHAGSGRMAEVNAGLLPDHRGFSGPHTFFAGHELPEVDAGYYLGIYALLGFIYVTITFSREIVLFWGSQRASWTFHDKLLNNILRATFRFFDSTPLGQLTNRFSKDVQTIDQEVAPVAIGLLHSTASVVTIVILISVVTPGFLIPGFFIACMYIATGLFYVRSSRDLKRIESVQRSPLFQHFGETLSGVVTIRAYGDEARFVQDSHNKVNTHNRPFIYLWATNRWLAFRVDVAGAFVSFFTATFILVNDSNIDAGAAGLSLSYAITFTQNVLWLVRLYAANEQNMNAVERIQEYIDVEQEAPAEVPETKPEANWPSRGAIQFTNYSTRYRKDLEPVLRNLSFSISAGEKIGIVGRTGAGKSSLALALFRGLEAEQGKILIDEIDIGLIGLQDLRQAITIVPQDPTLFSGTLRSNLDPFESFTDEEVFTALRRVQLISSKYSENDANETLSNSTEGERPAATNDASEPSSTSFAASAAGTMSSDATLVKYASNSKDSNKNIFLNLSSMVTESGSNLSQGQRQLLCLARALLKAPKVLIMDEATASIDYATDSKIQETLRELRGNTIITIAHRLQTVIDYDKVLVLDKGELVEYGDPWDLIRKVNGSFRAMCETNGDIELLTDLAQKSWEGRRLVDDS